MNKKKGFALILVVFMSIALFAIAMTIGILSRGQQQATSLEAMAEKAMYYADTGIDWTIQNLNKKVAINITPFSPDPLSPEEVLTEFQNHIQSELDRLTESVLFVKIGNEEFLEATKTGGGYYSGAIRLDNNRAYATIIRKATPLISSTTGEHIAAHFSIKCTAYLNSNPAIARTIVANVLVDYLPEETQHTETSTTTTIIEKKSFSDYLCVFDKTTYWGNDEEIYGPIHTNQKFYMAGHAFDNVYSVGQTYDYIPFGPYANQHTGIFEKGYQTGVSSIDFNISNDAINAVKTIANASGLGFSGNVDIVFNAGDPNVDGDGTVTINGVTYPLSDNAGQDFQDGTHIPQTVIYATGNITLKGKVDGRVTIATQGKVTITDNLTYQHPPIIDPNAGVPAYVPNVLAILAKGNVEISPSAPDFLTIHASVASQTGDFTVSSSDSCHTYNPSQYKMWFMGSMASFAGQGAPAIYCGNNKYKGYETQYTYYDYNLKRVRPPYFPMIGSSENVTREVVTSQTSVTTYGVNIKSIGEKKAPIIKESWREVTGEHLNLP